MKTVVIWVTAGFVSITAGASATTYRCDITTRVTIDGKTQEMRSTAWMRSPAVYRYETVAGRQVRLAIGNRKDAWQILPAAKTGFHATRSIEVQAQLARRKRILGDDLEAFLNAGAVKVGRETLNGVTCEHFRVTQSGLTHELWVTTTPDRLTLKQVTTGRATYAAGVDEPMQDHSINRTITYRWTAGVKMAGSLFRPAPGTKIKEGRPIEPPILQYAGPQVADPFDRANRR